jgi:carbon storage regulator
MLVLSRKLNEKILLGDAIVVTVVAIRGNQVRLGIEAPRDVEIVRAELDAERQRQPNGAVAPFDGCGVA